MKIYVSQIRILSGQFEKNFNTVKDEITTAKNQEADVIVFPELSLSGTTIMDEWKNNSVIDELLDYNQKIVQLSDGITIIWGNVAHHQGELFNSGYVAQNKEIIFEQNKQFSTSASLGFNKKYFSYKQNLNFDTFQLMDKTCALMINNDLLVHEYTDVDILFHLDNHSFRKEDSLDKKLETISKVNQTIISVNGVGAILGTHHFGLMDGHSFVKHQDEIVLLNGLGQSESQLVDLETMTTNKTKSVKLLDILVQSIKYIDEEVFSFKPHWFLGYSGGLDSSVSASLLTIALGKERVSGINLVSQYNSETTKSNAANLAQALGTEFKTIYLKELIDATINAFDQPVDGLALENVQARLRAHILMTEASINNGVVSNNTNKVEAALGYGTMYGDTIGALGLLADLTKMEVAQVAREINEYYNKEVVPYILIPKETETGLEWQFKPSAELKDNQVDPMKWGYHDVIIERLLKEPNAKVNILKEYINGQLLDSKIGHYMRDYGLDNPDTFIEDYTWVLNTMARNAFKRAQGVPMIVISESALGLDYIENQQPRIITQEMNQLIQEIKGL